MHLFESFLEALAAYGIHRQEGECLCEWHTVRAPMQKFNLCLHFPKHRTENYFPECSLRNWPLHKQTRPSCQ